MRKGAIMVKRILSLLLVITLTLGSISVGFVNSFAADDTMTKLVALIKKFPNGKYWNHTDKNDPDSVTSSPCSNHRNCDYFGNCSCNSFGGAIQCMGYAAKISYEITGVDRYYYDESYSLNVNKLRVGDIIRADGHSVCVTGVNGNKIAITDCNYGSKCIIRWTTVDVSWFDDVDYVLHLKSNDRTNKDVTFHDAYNGTVTPIEPSNPSQPTDPDDNKIKGDAEIWQMEDEDSLNIRKSMSTNAQVVGLIPASARFDVYDKALSGNYLWAKVNYDGVEGYSVLNYAEYVSGKHEIPDFTDVKQTYPSSKSMKVVWNEVSGADKYKLSLYSSDKKLLKTYTSTENSYSIPAQKAGKYYISVKSESSVAPSWSIEGQAKQITVIQEDVAVTAVTLRETGSIEVGKSGKFSPKVEPENATDKTLIWTSSDEKIATVDSDGTVTGISSGKVIIKCTSKQNSKLSASCSFTVKPSSVKTIQTVAGTAESSIGLKWSKSEGATGYTLYRYNENTKKYVKLAQGKGTSYTDKGLQAGKAYVYAVRPYFSDESVTINASYKTLTAKTNPTAIKTIKQTGSDTGRVRLQWDKKSGADTYVIYKYNPTTKKYEKLASTKNTVFIDSDKPATKVYYRIVSAVKTGDGYSLGKPSGTFTAITGLQNPKLSVKASGNSSIISWNKVDYATHYQIYRIIDGKTVLLKTVTSDKTAYTDKNLKKGVTYTYYVRAVRNHSSSLKLYSNKTMVKVKVAK